MRVLLDTNVLVSTAIKPAGKPAQIFQQADIRYALVCTEHVLDELADVLGRPHLQKNYSDLVAAGRREQFIAVVRSLADMVEPQTTLAAVSDPDDNHILAGAVEGRADFLVTGDPHLLKLRAYDRCKIVSPDQFLSVLRENQSD